MRAFGRRHVIVPLPARSGTVGTIPLEEQLHVTLFFRNKKRMVLTDAGRAFLLETQKSLEQFERAKAAAKRAQRGELGEFAIGFGRTAGLSVLPQIIRRFRRLYPEVNLVLRELGTEGQLQGVERRELDLAMGYTRVDEKKFAVNLLRPEQLVVLLPRGHRLTAHKTVTVLQLKDEPLILPRRSAAACIADAILSVYAAHNLIPPCTHQVETPQMAYTLVAAGLGLSLTTPSTLALLSLAVDQRPLREKHAPVQLSTFWRKDNASPVLRNFWSLAEQATQRR